MTDAVLDRDKLDKPKAEQLPSAKWPLLKDDKGRELGDYTGTPVGKVTLHGSKGAKHVVTVAEEYYGIGPLVVKTPRGEVKAISGDLILRIIDDEADPNSEAAKPLYHVIPFEIKDAILDYTPPVREAEKVEKPKPGEIEKEEPSPIHKLPAGTPTPTPTTPTTKK